jgi:hypothetical protein
VWPGRGKQATSRTHRPLVVAPERSFSEKFQMRQHGLRWPGGSHPVRKKRRPGKPSKLFGAGPNPRKSRRGWVLGQFPGAPLVGGLNAAVGESRSLTDDEGRIAGSALEEDGELYGERIVALQ